VLRVALLAGVFLAAASTAAEAGALTVALAGLKAVAAKTALGSFLYNLAGSLLFSFLAAKLAPKPKQPDLKRDIAQPQSRQPYRFVYGRNRVYGSPLPLRVKGTILYGCLLLNSRPSEGNFSFYLDKRAATIAAGDLYDFTGTGAELTIQDFPDFGSALQRPRIWISRGDKTTPPDTLVSEAPEFFQASDGWQGRTVMWLRFDAGEAKRRQDRWPAVPPEVEVEGDWSKVWDPRDLAQDPDDPDTWTYSDNQALCLLDALRQNPIRRYPLDSVHLPSFSEAADVADETVGLFYPSNNVLADTTIIGSTGLLGFGPIADNALASHAIVQAERRYRVGGLLVWNGSEIMDQVAPLIVAGGGDIVRIGGRVGYAAGAYRAPIYTLTDFIDEGGIDLQTLVPGRELPRAVRASYVNPRRDWQAAEVPEIEVVGGQGIGDEGILELDLGFVTSATQAMRLQQIEARKLALQRRLSVTLWPDAFEVVAGATINANMPAPFTRLNGLWQVESANPSLWIANTSGGVAMRIPVTMRQITPDVYDWVPETDEMEVFFDEFDPSNPISVDPNMALPTGLTATPVGLASLTIAVVQAEDTFVDGVEVFWSLTNDVTTAEFLFDAFPGAGQSASFVHDARPILTHYYWARSIRQPSLRSNFTSPVVSAMPASP
jgi:hypothetical protein